jgi:hypothetical protein
MEQRATPQRRLGLHLLQTSLVFREDQLVAGQAEDYEHEVELVADRFVVDRKQIGAVRTHNLELLRCHYWRRSVHDRPLCVSYRLPITSKIIFRELTTA